MQLILDVLHVVAIGEDDAVFPRSVLILDLDEDDGTGYASLSEEVLGRDVLELELELYPPFVI